MKTSKYHIGAVIVFYCLWFALGAITLAGCDSGMGNIPSASQLTSGKVTLSWDTVPGAVSYDIYWSTAPGVTWRNGRKIPHAANPIAITGLQPGTVYYFIVIATGAGGKSRPSKEAAYKAGDPHNRLQLTFPASAQVTLAWDNVPNATAYNIYWRDKPGVTKRNGRKISNVKNPYTLTGLQPGHTYYFMVTAVSGSRESQASAEIAFTAPQ